MLLVCEYVSMFVRVVLVGLFVCICGEWYMYVVFGVCVCVCDQFDVVDWLMSH